MKLCPHCGAELLSDAASFCMECGETIQHSDEKKAKRMPEKKANKSQKARMIKEPTKLNRKRNDGYDGYYDDVLPIDHGQLKEGLDKDLIKKIAAVFGVMLLIVILCVVAMYLL